MTSRLDSRSSTGEGVPLEGSFSPFYLTSSVTCQPVLDAQRANCGKYTINKPKVADNGVNSCIAGRAPGFTFDAHNKVTMVPKPLVPYGRTYVAHTVAPGHDFVKPEIERPKFPPWATHIPGGVGGKVFPFFSGWDSKKKEEGDHK